MKFERWIRNHTNHLTVITGILIVAGLGAKWLGAAAFSQWLLAIASVIAAIPVVINAIEALRYKTISIELLVSIAVIGAFIIQEYAESAVVTFLFLFGSYLENKTLAKTRQSIKKLTEMAPTTANVVQPDGSVSEEDVDFLDEGDVVLVKTGGQVPVDGTIVSGAGYVNEASITGEAKPVKKQVGEAVFSGSLLTNGTVQIEATKVGDETTFAKIIELVEEAQDAKSPAEKFIDRFATYYTPAVLVLALLVWLFSQDFKLAITVLVLGCPGALVIGAPVSNVAGIGNGANHGVLIKGGDVMATLAKVDTFVFDKTGTLTRGETTVSAYRQYGNAPAVLPLVAKVEQQSDHPLGKAIIDYAADHAEQVAVPQIEQVATIKGQGLVATLENGEQLLVGNLRLLTANQVLITKEQEAAMRELQQAGSSTVLVALNAKLVALIGVADQIRPEVATQLGVLRNLGAQQLIMLTGDNQATAQAVGDQLGLDRVEAELLPEDKLTIVKELQAAGHKVAFVGDGINDSPSIATADIGIAMGGGTDVAVETSDVVLMRSDFAELVHGYGLAQKTMANLRENITIAILTVGFLLVGLMLGYIYMASGMLVHEGSILVVIFNAMRLLKYQVKKPKLDADQVNSTNNVLQSK
ncbi:cadmium-exporting ATPase [Lentilactobacillus senioris DSM 24302 = JCM 17472]|uniref:Cd(2+)-exporting ATPase n=1 Tax=Lentilactobacillus senioris DSM 24302 = JCM 17472 TaxID=1423802 RepID=A0A0R2CRJ3_9LACO|nr:heavy metal translocating P-type ATPase [Lentilactobacillus senioris]KRM94414.1 cadmium-exporting ATPase [Lentilactobacillus senioris DSM 24302 = JCM 17472]